MLWKLAIRTLVHDRGKLIAGLIGVIFSVVLVNIQGGLFLGLISKASLLVDRSNADIWIGHRGMHNVDFPHNLPLRWLHRVRGIHGVDEVEPLRIAFSEMSLPDGEFESVVVVGVSENTMLGRAYEVVEGPHDAQKFANGVVVDQCDDSKLGYPRIGEIREIGGRRTRITGKCHGVLSFLVAPYVFTTHDRAVEISNSDPEMTSYFLVKLAEGHESNRVCDQIRQRLPEATVMTRDGYAMTSIKFWLTRTGIGLSFGAATIMGLLVGMVMVGQTLYAMVLDRISEFATLKAIGASEKELILLLGAQAVLVAVSGIIVGTILSLSIGNLFSTPRTEINIPFQLCSVSAILVFSICLCASALPYWRVRRLDPYSVLQG